MYCRGSHSMDERAERLLSLAASMSLGYRRSCFPGLSPLNWSMPVLPRNCPHIVSSFPVTLLLSVALSSRSCPIGIGCSHQKISYTKNPVIQIPCPCAGKKIPHGSPHGQSARCTSLPLATELPAFPQRSSFAVVLDARKTLRRGRISQRLHNQVYNSALTARPSFPRGVIPRG